MPYTILSSDEVRAREIILSPNAPPNLKVIAIDCLDAPYPIVEFYMAELPGIQILWEEHIEARVLGDARGRKRGLQWLDPARLQYDVKKGENIIFVNSITSRTVAVVIQGLIQDEGIINSFDNTIVDHLNNSQPTRLSSAQFETSQDI